MRWIVGLSVLLAACGSKDTGTASTTAGSGVASTTGAPATGSGTGTGTGTGAVTGTGTGTGAGTGTGTGASTTWPSCTSQPPGVNAATLPDLWTSNPSVPEEVWVSGAIVTSVSGGGCAGGAACWLTLQDAPTYASFDAGAQHGIRLWVSGAEAQRFTGIAVGDVVDVLGWLARDTTGGANELRLAVDTTSPGCAEATGTASPTPIPDVTLDQLTVAAFQTTHGPLLVRLPLVSGRPTAQDETFGLWPTGVVWTGEIVSLAPDGMPNATFVGMAVGSIMDFTSVSGVFVAPHIAGTTYAQVWPRSTSDLVISP